MAYRLSDVIKNLLQDTNISAKIELAMVEQVWSATVGKIVSDNTKITKLIGNILTVKTDGPAWRNELTMQKQEIIQKLNILDAQFKKLFKTATEKSVESNNYLVISRVLSMLGSAAGERALHFLTLKINDRAEIEKKLCKGAFMCSKGLLIKTQDQGELALLMHNFANSLRNIGETEEALDLVVKSIKIAKKLNIPDFIDKAEKLKDRIIHPVEIPSIK